MPKGVEGGGEEERCFDKLSNRRREKIGREEIEERKYRCLRESKAEG
jgi:hypothetical protein